MVTLLYCNYRSPRIGASIPVGTWEFGFSPSGPHSRHEVNNHNFFASNHAWNRVSGGKYPFFTTYSTYCSNEWLFIAEENKGKGLVLGCSLALAINLRKRLKKKKQKLVCNQKEKRKLLRKA